jgi:hypothetical protein
MAIKYELLDSDIIEVDGVTLKRIKALVAIAGSDVVAGDLGGYIQSEDNLSMDGDAWVFGDARVFGTARVFGDAWVKNGEYRNGY